MLRFCLFFLLFFSTDILFSQETKSKLDSIKAIGNHYLAINQDSADFHFTQLLEHFKTNDDLVNWLNTNKFFANWYRKNGNVSKSIEIYEAAYKTVFRNPTNQAEWKRFGNFLNHYGYTAERHAGNFQKAGELYNQSLSIFDDTLNQIDFANYAYVVHNLGNVYTRSGDYEKALILLNTKKQLIQKSGDYSQLSGFAGDISTALASLGRHEEAIRELEGALSIVDKTPYNLSFLYQTLARRKLETGALENAYAAAEKSMKNIEKIPNEEKYRILGWRHNNLNIFASINQKRNNHTLAEFFFSRAISAVLEDYQSSSRREVGKQYIARADFYLHTDNLEKSLDDFQIALTTVLPNFEYENNLQNPNDSTFYAENTIMEALEGKANVLNAFYKKTNDKEYLKRELETRRLILSVEKELRNAYSYESSKLLIGAESRGRTEKAIDAAYELMQKTGNRKFLEDAFFFAEQSKATVLIESLKQLSAKEKIGNSEDLEALQQLLNRRNYFKTQLIQEQDSLRKTEIKETIVDLDRKVEAAEYRLKSSNPSAFVQIEAAAISVSETQKLLGDRILIEYFIGEKNSYVFKIDKEGLEVIPLNETTRFNYDLNGFLKIFTESNWELPQIKKYVPLANSLYENLLKPLNLPSNRRLLIVPDGQLFFLPFDALLTEKVNDLSAIKRLPYLLRKQIISYAYSATALKEHKNLAEKQTALDFLSIAPQEFSYDSNLVNLTTASMDAFLEKEGFSEANLLNKNACVDSFLVKAKTSKVIQFFTHAAADEPPYIAFFDRKFYLHEIYSNPISAQLIILGACETGLGELQAGEGSMSLARGFAYAGVPATVMSLWSIGEHPTSEILQNFYKNLNLKTSKDIALNFAKVQYLETADNENSTPWHWASLSLIGSTEPIALQSGFNWAWLLFGLFFAAVILYFLTSKKKRKLKLAFDVHYKEEKAKTVCAVFKKWEDKTAKSFKIKYLDEVEEYIPGQFYKRELPCIMTVLDDLDLSEIDTIIIDGFVVLDDAGNPGLGQYLYEKLNQKIPIIGVAKTGFHNNVKNVKQVFRGESKKPLYVTAAGMDVHEAAMHIQEMSGDYRMPDILREVDSRTKED